MMHYQKVFQLVVMMIAATTVASRAIAVKDDIQAEDISRPIVAEGID